MTSKNEASTETTSCFLHGDYKGEHCPRCMRNAAKRKKQSAPISWETARERVIAKEVKRKRYVVCFPHAPVETIWQVVSYTADDNWKTLGKGPDEPSAWISAYGKMAGGAETARTLHPPAWLLTNSKPEDHLIFLDPAAPVAPAVVASLESAWDKVQQYNELRLSGLSEYEARETIWPVSSTPTAEVPAPAAHDGFGASQLESFTLTLRWDSEAQVFVGKCIEYNCLSQGRTLEESAVATISAVRLLKEHSPNLPIPAPVAEGSLPPCAITTEETLELTRNAGNEFLGLDRDMLRVLLVEARTDLMVRERQLRAALAAQPAPVVSGGEREADGCIAGGTHDIHRENDGTRMCSKCLKTSSEILASLSKPEEGKEQESEGHNDIF